MSFKYVLLHRPKQYVGPAYGVAYPAIWIKFSEDLLDWEDKPSRLLLAGRPGTWEEKVGGSTPPILTDAGWLMLYHGVADGGRSRYSVGAALLDREDPTRVLARLPEPILEPDLDAMPDAFSRRAMWWWMEPCMSIMARRTNMSASPRVCWMNCWMRSLVSKKYNH